MKKIYILGAVVLGLAACKPTIEPKAPERGDADFSGYLAVGSDYTAGFTDGSLYRNGQLNSYPRMLADQFASVGGGEFRQPLVPGQHGWPMGKLILDYTQGPCDSVQRIDRVLFTGALDTAGTSNNIYSRGPFNNMAIPHSKAVDYLVPAYGMQNVYAARMFKTPVYSRPVDELLLPTFTFFTVWLGMSDVLDFASAGGKEAGDNPGNRLPSAQSFRVAYDSVITTITRNGAKGVVLTIPDVLDMPFFTARLRRGLDLNIRDANRLNLQYNGSQVHFNVGKNYYVIEDSTTAEGFRHIKEGEYIRLDIPHDSITCNGWGSEVPIPGEWVITEDEIQAINGAIYVFNNIIKQTAQQYNVGVIDTRYFLQQVAENGIQYNGAEYSFNDVQGGYFSLDGLHFNGRGNAFLANYIIDGINAYYKSSLPYVDVNNYSATRVP